MKKLIEIKLINDDVVRINYTVTGSCTYSCRYCPEHLHEGKHLPINITDLKTFFNKFYNKKLILTLTGGECTTHPQFREILELAKSLNINVAVDTNGVRTKRFYDDHKDLVGNWNFTLHPSQHTLDLEKIEILTDHSFVVVLISMDPDHWEKSLEWLDKVSTLKNIKIIPIKLISNWAGSKYNVVYDSFQEEFLKNTRPLLTFTEERKKELLISHQWLSESDSKAVYDDLSTDTVDPFAIIKEGQNVFTGWDCYAGKNTLLLNPDGSVNWANCGIKKFQNFLDIDLEKLNDPTVCTLSRCECGTDIRSTKISVGR